MSNGPSTEFKKRILEEVKKLSDKGERLEAYELFKVYFPFTWALSNLIYL